MDTGERILGDIIPLAIMASTSAEEPTFDKVVGSRQRKKKYPSAVRCSGRLMQSDSVSIMEKAEYNAARKSLEATSSVDPGMSNSLILGTTLVKSFLLLILLEILLLLVIMWYAFKCVMMVLWLMM